MKTQSSIFRINNIEQKYLSGKVSFLNNDGEDHNVNEDSEHAGVVKYA